MMGWQLVQRVKAIPPGWMTSDERLVLFVFADIASDDFVERPTAWPSLATVAAGCGYANERRLRSRIDALVEAGFLRKARDRRNKQGKWSTSIWILELPEPSEWGKDGVRETSLQRTRKALALLTRSERLQSHSEPSDGRRTMSTRTEGSHRAEPEAHSEPTITRENFPSGSQSLNDHLAALPRHAWKPEDFIEHRPDVWERAEKETQRRSGKHSPRESNTLAVAQKLLEAERVVA